MPLTKPRFRGRLHQITACAVLPAGLVLVLMARDASAVVAATIYTLSAAALFGTSAAYHRGRWSERARATMRKLDHAMIFVLIAGSFTPVALLAMRPAWGVTLLTLAWAVAVVGAALTLIRFDFMDRHGGYLYVAFGWCLGLALPGLLPRLSTVQLVLLAAGGVLYTVGAILFGLKRPRLRPHVFGYHEAWHVMTVLAAGCHYAMVMQLVRA